MDNNIEFIKHKQFNPDTGIAKYLDDNIGIKINELGFFEEYIIDTNKEINSKVLKSSTHYRKTLNENDISKELFGETKDINFDKTIGYYTSIYTGHVMNEELRSNSSSGGMGTWIGQELMKCGYIDGLIHIGYDYSKSSFKYKISRNLEEISEISKTRYYPVELSEVLCEVEKVPGKYAIIGTPSFISSVRLLQKINPIFEERIVFTIGLVCGHQKSKFFTEYLGWQLGILPENLEFIDYRVKLESKPANQYGVRAIGKNNYGELIDKTVQITDLKGQNWGKGFFKKESSDFIDDVFNETADITLGDAWLDKYNQDSKGNNIVIIRNSIIDELIKNAIKREELNLVLSTKEEIIQSQISHVVHTQNELSYRINKFALTPFQRRNYNYKIIPSRKLIQVLRRKLRDNSLTYFVEAKSRKDLSYFDIKMGNINNLYDYIYKYTYYKLRINRLMTKLKSKLSRKKKQKGVV